MSRRWVMRRLVREDRDTYGYDVLLLECGHTRTTYRTGKRATAKWRLWQVCDTCTDDYDKCGRRGDDGE